VPRVMLAAVRGRGRRREELLVTEAVEAECVIPLIEQADAAATTRLVANLGEAVAQLHHAGVRHGHLVAGHLHADEDGRRVVFIDNDENKLLPKPLPWRRRRQNLEQLLCRLLVLVKYDKVRRFLGRYLSCAEMPRAECRRWLAALLRRVRQRRANLRARRLAQGTQMSVAPNVTFTSADPPLPSPRSCLM